MKENVSDKTYKDPEERKEELREQKSSLHVLLDGILFENPVLCQVLGTCPLLAITTSAKNAFFMGLAVIFVQIGSEVIISMVRKAIPDKVRIPAFITIIAGFVTIVQMLVSAYLPALNDSLGIYIPLIVVNCIVLARAEAFASKNKVVTSFFDGLGMGVGYMIALLLMGSVREILGNGTFFGLDLLGSFQQFLQHYTILGMDLSPFGSQLQPMMFFILPPGGFFVFGLLICFAQIFMKKINRKRGKKDMETAEMGHCGACGSCTACSGSEGGKV